MINDISELKDKIIKLRQEDGYTVSEVLNELKIKSNIYDKVIKQAKQEGIYDEELIKKAKTKRKNKEREKEKKINPSKVLSENEEMYRKRCIDFMARRYFDYDNLHKFNPLLITKIQKLHDITSYQVIFNTMKIKQVNMDYAHEHKEFASDVQKMSYLIAIIKNSLNTTSKKIQDREKIAKAKDSRNADLFLELNKTYKTAIIQKTDMTSLLDDE